MQTVLITGGNSGLGYEVAKKFLKEGYNTIITCRNEQKATVTIHNLKAETGKNTVSALVVKLNDLKDIERVFEGFIASIDILICNAGMAYENLPVKYSADGIEETFAVNHLAHFYTFTLLAQKQNTLKKGLVVSSNLHSPELSKGFAAAPNMENLALLAFPELNGRLSNKKALGFFYPNSKLCNVLFGYEIGRKYPDMISSVLNPGFMPSTGLPRFNSVLVRWILKNIFPYFVRVSKGMRTPKESAEDAFFIINEATSSGKYYDGRVTIDSSQMSYDKNLAKKLWNFSEQLMTEKL